MFEIEPALAIVDKSFPKEFLNLFMITRVLLHFKMEICSLILIRYYDPHYQNGNYKYLWTILLNGDNFITFSYKGHLMHRENVL